MIKITYKSSGIYRIRNLVNNHIYIGSAKTLLKRKCVHFSQLKLNKHANWHLQNAYNKYGKKNFVFEVLITCDQSTLIWYEQQFLDLWKPKYNIRSNATSFLGMKVSEETKQKIREKRKLQIISKETGRKISKATKGKKRSEETRIRMSGKPHVDVSSIKLLSPDGIIVTNIKFFTGFCQKYGLDRSHMSKVMRGIVRSCKGWRLYKPELSEDKYLNATFKSPDGQIIKINTRMADFCRKYNLTPDSVSKLLHGKLFTHKGWSICQ